MSRAHLVIWAIDVCLFFHLTVVPRMYVASTYRTGSYVKHIALNAVSRRMGSLLQWDVVCCWGGSDLSCMPHGSACIDGCQ
jgi:hypothetical protein